MCSKASILAGFSDSSMTSSEVVRKPFGLWSISEILQDSPPQVLQKLQNPATDLMTYYRHLHFPPFKPRRKCLPRRFTVAQVTILEARFQENPYISRNEKIEMAKIIGSTPLQIKRWFKNQREVQRRSFKRIFTDVRRNLLNSRFQENPFITDEDAEYLAMVTGLTKAKIKKWFSYKRCLQGRSKN